LGERLIAGANALARSSRTGARRDGRGERERGISRWIR
jgi:hypothetical protein